MLSVQRHWHEWMHMHKVDWHKTGLTLQHWVSDPRFWAGLAIFILFAVMLLVTFLAAAGQHTHNEHAFPINPYMPY